MDFFVAARRAAGGLRAGGSAWRRNEACAIDARARRVGDRGLGGEPAGFAVGEVVRDDVDFVKQRAGRIAHHMLAANRADLCARVIAQHERTRATHALALRASVCGREQRRLVASGGVAGGDLAVHRDRDHLARHATERRYRRDFFGALRAVLVEGLRLRAGGEEHEKKKAFHFTNPPSAKITDLMAA